MGEWEQKKQQQTLAFQADEKQQRSRSAQRVYMDELDEQLEAAMKRWELTLGGLDAHKVMAERLTDDPERPVSTSQVYDIIARRNGRHPWAELIHELCDVDEKFNAWWNESKGYDAPKRRPRLPLDEQVRLLSAALLHFGPAGEEKLRQIQTAQPVANGERK